MITDEKRREVAEKMRGYDVSEFKESAIVPFLDCLGVGYLNWREVLDALADLIDRPMTRNIAEPPEFKCELCGAEWPFEMGFVCCPECGAEVIVDD